MTICDQLESRSMALLSLPPSHAERLAAEAHAASCPACERSLREGARLLKLVDLELQPRRSARSLAAVESAVLAEWDRDIQRAAPVSRLLAAGCALALFVFLCATARHLVHDVSSWATAVAAASLAALLAGSASAGGRTVLFAIAASLALVLAPATGGIVGSESGMGCLGLELAGALAPFAFWRIACGPSPEPPSAAASAALAGSAALAVQAALHLSCPVRGALFHLLVFHFAGVVLAATAGFGLRIALKAR